MAVNGKRNDIDECDFLEYLGFIVTAIKFLFLLSYFLTSTKKPKTSYLTEVTKTFPLNLEIFSLRSPVPGIILTDLRISHILTIWRVLLDMETSTSQFDL